MKRPGRALLGRIGLGLLGLALLLQVLPIGQPRTNPPVQQDAPWPSERARSLAVGACYACHSNETSWPLYSYVAPMKWLVTSDVARGRRALNFSEWGIAENEPNDAVDTIEDGSMPPLQYRLIHGDARLNDAEMRELIQALESMDPDGDQDDGGGGRGRGGDDDGDGG
jgi:hypothetical protein